MFRFNNLLLLLGLALKFYSSVADGLKLKVTKVLGLDSTLSKITWEKLVRGIFCPCSPQS